MNKEIFAVLGGDERYWLLAEMLAENGHKVMAVGFERLEKECEDIIKADVAEAVDTADCVILPFPPSRDGIKLNAPFAAQPLEFDSFSGLLSGKEIFTGASGKLVRQRPELTDMKLLDYSLREDFLLRNAYATAEALLMLSVELLPKTLDECRVMITGFGRIGGYTAEMLVRQGAHVICATHSPEKRVLIERAGGEAVNYDEAARAAGNADLVINTADALVVDGSMIRNMRKSAKIIDAASLPGGTDLDAAKYYGIEVVPALGLPGKYSPETAAKAVLEAVFELKKEDHI